MSGIYTLWCTETGIWATEADSSGKGALSAHAQVADANIAVVTPVAKHRLLGKREDFSTEVTVMEFWIRI
jgi:hypothetical protein